jgi:hypothetical protein
MTTTHNVKKLAGKALLSGAAALVALGLASGTAQAFNPQPDPPGKPAAVAVNPQPETSERGIIAVNPQPQLPSKPQIAARGGSA